MTIKQVDGQTINSEEIESQPLEPSQQIYKENILDHFRNPRNKTVLENPTVSRHDFNQSCGDEIEFTVQIEDGVITSVGWTGKGCAISQASASMVSRKLKGLSTKEVLGLDQEYVLNMLGIPIGIVRRKCAMLGLRCVQKAIEEGTR